MSIDKDMQELLIKYGRAVIRDGNPAFESGEGIALLARIRQMLEDKPSADGPVNPHPAGSEEAEAWDCGYHNKRVRRDGLGAHLAKVWREGWDARALMLRAEKLIAIAAKRGLRLSLDHVYGRGGQALGLRVGREERLRQPRTDASDEESR